MKTPLIRSQAAILRLLETHRLYVQVRARYHWQKDCMVEAMYCRLVPHPLQLGDKVRIRRASSVAVHRLGEKGMLRYVGKAGEAKLFARPEPVVVRSQEQQVEQVTL